MKVTHTTCRNFDTPPWAIRWRLRLADWLIRHEMLTRRMGFRLQKGIDRADFRRWHKHID